MGGIEVLAAAVIFILGTVGLVRGPSKELGVTMALVVMLAVFTQFDTLTSVDELPDRVNNALEGLGLGSDDALKRQTMVVFLYSAAISLTAFMAYHGQDTLKFSFKDPGGFLGSVVGWLTGALNGYLIFGTIWYYLDMLDYPIKRYAWFEDRFTDLAENMVNLLPQNLASGMVLSAVALALLWWRILK
jgi:uncharacterized membrane protein required for colicin V production